MDMNHINTRRPRGTGRTGGPVCLGTLLDDLFRTGGAESLATAATRRNIYFLRGPEGPLEFFCNVSGAARRQQLMQSVCDSLHDVPSVLLREETIVLDADVPPGCLLDYFSEQVTSAVPASRDLAGDGMFLDRTVLCVLHADGDGLHAHRLYTVPSGKEI